MLLKKKKKRKNTARGTASPRAWENTKQSISGLCISFCAESDGVTVAVWTITWSSFNGQVKSRRGAAQSVRCLAARQRRRPAAGAFGCGIFFLVYCKHTWLAVLLFLLFWAITWRSQLNRLIMQTYDRWCPNWVFWRFFLKMSFLSPAFNYNVISRHQVCFCHDQNINVPIIKIH